MLSALIAIRINNNEVVGSGEGLKYNVAIKSFLIAKAKIALIKLKQVFTKALIL